MNNPKKQTGKKSKKPWLILVGFVLMLLSALLIFLYGKNSTSDKKTDPGDPGDPGDPDPDPEDPAQDPELQEQKSYANDLVELFVKYGLSQKEGRYWVSVSAHETKGFTSSVFNTNKNLFGMKQPEERETTSIGQKGNYASYDSDEDSVKDLVLWIQAREFPKEHDSIRKLTSDMKAKGYFTDTYLNYTNGVLYYNKKLFNS